MEHGSAVSPSFTVEDCYERSLKRQRSHPSASVVTHVDDSLVVLELCAGSAILSAILKRDGFETIPVDFQGNRQRPHTHVLNMDLRQPATWRFLQWAVVNRRVLHVHAGLPSGACSRTRGAVPQDGETGSQPLRDTAHPMGFPCSAADSERVRNANLVYVQLAQFCTWLHSLGIGFTIENPIKSLLWCIPEFVQLQDFAHFVSFDACVFDSPRQLGLAFLTNVSEFDVLARQCTGAHKHAAWDATTDAAYPKPLCEAMSDALKIRARALGFEVDSTSLPATLCSRASAQTQSRRPAGPPLISEYEYTQTLSTMSADVPMLSDKMCLVRPFHSVPVGSKLLRRIQAGGTNQPEETVYTFGIFRSQWQFVSDAKAVLHPFDTCCALPDHMLIALADILTRGPLAIMKFRLELITKWSSWEKELRASEKALRESLPPGVAKVLAGKNLLLLERIAEDLDWPDKHLISDIQSGFKLTGNPIPSGILAPEFKPAILEEADLWKQAKFIKPALWSKVANQGTQPFSEELWRITLEECEDKGWLNGPFTWEQLENKFQGKWLPCRRFGVFQRDKWRPIDDFSENGVNSAYTVCDKVHLRALDETVWLSVTLMRFMRDKGSVDFKLSTGQRICGRLHEFWRSNHYAGRPMVKTIDMKSAYKQFALHPDEYSKSIICIKNPKSEEVQGFECLTLPFGSVSSVVCFNRISRLFQRVLNEARILASSYYDDFPIVECEKLISSTQSTVRAISALLGFRLASEKEHDFSLKADLLGVTLDLEDSELKQVKVANKDSRLKEMETALSKILSQGKVVPLTLPALFGRLQFCEGQLLGRQGRLALADIRTLERSSAAVVNLSNDLRQSFSMLLQRLRCGKPRTIRASSPKPPVLVFTDGACEMFGDNFVGTIGGVMFVPSDSTWCIRAFGARVDSKVMRMWADKGKKHLIGPVELFAVVTARQCWSPYLTDRVIFFVDHGGVLASLIKGSSKDPTWRQLLLHFEQLDADSPSMHWFARVPSPSNISDGPSRSCWTSLEGTAFTRDFPKCCLTGRDLEQL